MYVQSEEIKALFERRISGFQFLLMVSNGLLTAGNASASGVVTGYHSAI